MDKKLKTKWLKALRGGQYLQGIGQLCSSDGERFCCLGVLADIQGCVWKETEFGDLYPIMPRGREIFGIDSSGGLEGGYLKPRRAGNLPLSDQKALARMNDEGVSFDKIADYIEVNL